MGSVNTNNYLKLVILLVFACTFNVGCDFIDECRLNGFYGDGECDAWCPQHDPDCDVCMTGTNGLCEPYCPQVDPDCTNPDGSDYCEERDWYGDGECDTGCVDDPDCEDSNVAIP